MTRLGFGVTVAIFGAVLTTTVAAAMGTILLFVTPDTPTPILTVDPTAVLAVGQFGVIVVGGVAVILLSAAAGGGTA
ncbi:hypothetical protein GJ631_10570 [Natronomonas sp. CBA1123]|uniref:hypothetical protein n=1 Tax=Natronomonas sp. CBA1123 TaxID=2668070 RepID=UPI0012EA175A|nr:hypothetical protein [Natronomonas sp. CBA1123]MUV86997.1 hypothetical protein [Natronomonas sp. CBA1123]